jgi:uncharacterized cupin superfamily protein
MLFAAAATIPQDYSSVQVGSTQVINLKSSPLKPEWIRAGNPVVRSLPLTESEDTLFSSGLWQCSAGEFKFIYECDEIVHILEGQVHIRAEGAELTLSAGDVAYFPKGLIAEWTVPHHVKKFCVFHSTPRSLLGRIKGRLMSLLGR